MSNVTNLNNIPTNPVMAEAFIKAVAAKETSPDIGGDTLQAELENMQAKPQPSSSKENTMHHTDGSDSTFSHVEDIMEPEFTGSHGRVKAVALSTMGSMLAATATAALLTRDSNVTKSVALSGLIVTTMLVGMEAVQAKRNPSVADRLTMSKTRAAKLLGGGMALGAASMTIGLAVGRIFRSGE